MTFRRNEPRALTRDLRYAAVVALPHVRVERLVGEEHHEWLSLRALHEAERVVRQDVGHVSLGFDALAVDVELRVGRLALPFHGHPVGPAGTTPVVVAHVPLPEEPGLVPGRGERNREGAEAVTGRIARGVVDDAVRVRVLAGEDGRATRRTERRGRERVQEPRAFARQLIDGGRLGEGVARDAEVVPAKVVDEDEHDVRRARHRTAARFTAAAPRREQDGYCGGQENRTSGIDSVHHGATPGIETVESNGTHQNAGWPRVAIPGAPAQRGRTQSFAQGWTRIRRRRSAMASLAVGAGGSALR